MRRNSRTGHLLQTVARLRPGSTLQRAGSEMDRIGAQLEQSYPATNKGRRFAAWPAMRLIVGRETQQYLQMLLGAVLFVLLIACANVANLLLARSAARQKEIAIRIALGSGRWRLMRQLLTESLVLSLAGAAMGTLFAQWGARLLVSFLSVNSNRVFLDLSIDGRVLAFTAGVSIVTAMLFGLAPAWRGTAVNPQAAMKANGRGVIEGGRFGLGKALVVAQVALSMMLVVGAGLMLTTFFRLETLDTGFDRQHVLLVNVDLRNGHYPAERRGAAMREMLQRLRALPAVLSASGSNITPVSGSTWNEDLIIDGYQPKGKDDTLVYFNEVSDRYFETMRMKLLAGRDFGSQDTPESPKVAIVNQTMAKKFFGGQNPVGRRYRAEEGNRLGPWTEIVGLVSDSNYENLRE
jgi:putative ABC transport system permease protein